MNSEIENESKIFTNKPQVFPTWYTQSLTNTVRAMVHVILTLIALVGIVLGNINGLTIGLLISLSKSFMDMVNAPILAITILVLILEETAEFMVYSMWVVYRILEIALLEIFHIINEVFDIGLIMVTSDKTRNQMVDRNKMYMAAMARKTYNMELLSQQTVTKRDTLTVTHNKIINKCINNTSVITREEKPETSVTIFTDMPQSNAQSIEELTGNDSQTRIVDLVSFVYAPTTNSNVSCRDDKLVKWRRQRFFSDETDAITLTQSNNQTLKDLTENRSNTRNDDLVSPASSPYVQPVVFSRVDKMAKWRPWRYFIARKQPVLSPSIRHNEQTHYRHHRRGPNVGPRDQNFMSFRTQNVGFNTHVPRTIVPPARPSFGQFWNGYRDYGVSFRPRIGQGYWAYGSYAVPPMFHQWPRSNTSQRTFGPHNY